MPCLVEPCWESEIIQVSTLFSETQANSSYLLCSLMEKKTCTDSVMEKLILGTFFPCGIFFHVFLYL